MGLSLHASVDIRAPVKHIFNLVCTPERLPEWNVSIERRGGFVKFVRAPALKSTGSFFRIVKTGEMLQVTQGTKIEDKHGRLRAPDISIQAGNTGDNPTRKDVFAIWDVKLRGESGDIDGARITDDEFRSFLVLRGWLDVPASHASVITSKPANDNHLKTGQR